MKGETAIPAAILVKMINVILNDIYSNAAVFSLLFKTDLIEMEKISEYAEAESRKLERLAKVVEVLSSFDSDIDDVEEAWFILLLMYKDAKSDH